MTAESPTRFRLGNHMVARTGYGAMQLTGPGVFGPPANRDEAIALLRTAIELGVDHIDTAQYYGPDVVNDLIRDALFPYPADLAIVSKVAVRRGTRGEILPYDEPAQLRAGIEDNLRSLRVDRLAAVNLRMPDDTALPDARFDDQLAAMIAARGDGLIEGVGLSNVSLAQLEHALTITDIVTVQNSYGLADRHSQDVLELTTERGISFAPYLPLGWPGEVRLRTLGNPVVHEIADRLTVAPAQVALAWLIGVAPNVLLIAGTASIEHLRENLAAADIELTADDRRALGELA
ncbi:MAG: pyridoxine 4-dehydrogenase [Actinomycetota bacterium]|nr:pyridoxine 4-dehydrogenase [Actinomycetota bacterium]